MSLDQFKELLALGPAGLLLAAIVYQHWQNEKRNAAFEKRQTELEAKRDAEHQARLQDANANQRALLEMGDKVHKAVDVLEQQMEQNAQRRR
jgi:hypothetical protein